MMRYARLLLPFGAVILFMLGCEEASLNGDGDSLDSMEADAKATEAVSALENEFFTFISDLESQGVDNPADIDFSASNALFREALALNPNHLDANFGAGLTELLIFSGDPQVQEVFDAWEAFLDTGSAFVADSTLGKSARSLGFSLLGGQTPSSLRILDVKQMAHAYLNLFNLAVSDPPTLEDIQVVIEAIFLPSLDYALERFEIVDDDTSYSFAITPRMQGDLAADTVEFDLTEVFLLEAAVNLVRSFASVAVAYTVGPSAYDSAAVVEFLSQGGGFLSLRLNGGVQMGKAKETILTASRKLDDAIHFLRAETDDQSDDIITLTPGDLTEADLDEVLQANADFRDYLENGLTLTEDWNDDGGLTDLTFNFSALFDSPVPDFKSLLPAYSVSVGRDTSYDFGDYYSLNIMVSDVIDVGSAGYYSYSRDHWYDSWDDQEYSNVDTTTYYLSIPRFTWVVDSLLNEFRGDPSLSFWSVYINWGGNLNAGQQTVQTTVYYSYETRIADFSYYTGIITFDADTYAEWVFPNPSMNGFLPDITSDADFKSTFGLTEADFAEVSEPLVIHFEFFSGGLYKSQLAALGRFRVVPWAQAAAPAHRR